MLNIIHETKDIIIVNKPAGQLSQGAKGFDLDLVSEVMTYNASQGKPAYAACFGTCPYCKKQVRSCKIFSTYAEGRRI